MSNRFLVRCAWAVAFFALAVEVRGVPALAQDGSRPRDAEANDEFPNAVLPNSAGGDLSLPETRGRVATVLVCMSIECPISNEYIPTLNRLADKFRTQGVRVVGINPNAGETLGDMAEHARRFKLAFPFVQDAGAKVSRRLRFKVTPEVCVFDSAGKLAYRGRIDDRYRARGGSADAAASTDLENAIAELLAGKPVSVSQTKAVGCPIQFVAPPRAG